MGSSEAVGGSLVQLQDKCCACKEIDSVWRACDDNSHAKCNYYTLQRVCSGTNSPTNIHMLLLLPCCEANRRSSCAMLKSYELNPQAQLLLLNLLQVFAPLEWPAVTVFRNLGLVLLSSSRISAFKYKPKHGFRHLIEILAAGRPEYYLFSIVLVLSGSNLCNHLNAKTQRLLNYVYKICTATSQ